jgi:hypothetical protein
MSGTYRDDDPRVAATSASSTMLIGNVHDMPPLIPEGLQHAFRSSESTTLCGVTQDGLIVLADLEFPYRGPSFIEAGLCRQCLTATDESDVVEE